MALIFAFLLCLSQDNERSFPSFSATESWEMKTGLRCCRQSWFPADSECPVPTPRHGKVKVAVPAWIKVPGFLPGCPWALSCQLPAQWEAGSGRKVLERASPRPKAASASIARVMETGNWTRTSWYCTRHSSQQLSSAEHQAGLILPFNFYHS